MDGSGESEEAMSETESEKLNRVRIMASGDPTWDLSHYDTDALKYVLAELDRLQAILDTICDGAKSEMWTGDGVVANVTLWTLPLCDGRNGSLLEAAEKARTAP